MFTVVIFVYQFSLSKTGEKNKYDRNSTYVNTSEAGRLLKLIEEKANGSGLVSTIDHRRYPVCVLIE